jgi:DNA-binding NtrC family response regulator
VSIGKFVSIVDDEPDITALFREALSSIKGISVFSFTDPTIALEHFTLNKDSYVLVISDLRMPGLNGMELLRKMKESNKLMRTILMTAFEMEDKIFHDYTKKKIIDGFIQEPIRLPDLIEKVETQLSLKTPNRN